MSCFNNSDKYPHLTLEFRKTSSEVEAKLKSEVPESCDYVHLLIMPADGANDTPMGSVHDIHDGKWFNIPAEHLCSLVTGKARLDLVTCDNGDQVNFSKWKTLEFSLELSLEK